MKIKIKINTPNDKHIQRYNGILNLRKMLRASSPLFFKVSMGL